MTIPFSKPAVDINKQLNILLARGLVVANQPVAIQALNSIGYYRLSGYLYPFRTRDASGVVLDTYFPGSTLEEVIQLYEFDRQLRLLLLDAIERIEVAVRTQVTYHFSLKYGPFGHANPNNFHAKFRHNDWLNDAQTEVIRSNDKFISHFQQKYDGYPVVPLWMLTEVISIGSLSRLYRGLENSDKLPIAAYFNIHHKRLTDWLHAITYIRNVCAHHSRLWNRELSISPDAIKDPNWSHPITPRNDRVFYILLILKELLSASGNGQDWEAKMNQLLLPIAIQPKWQLAMGFPANWQTHPIWSK
jgi:abortive infection bacteriophage resistance protein